MKKLLVLLVLALASLRVSAEGMKYYFDGVEFGTPMDEALRAIEIFHGEAPLKEANSVFYDSYVYKGMPFQETAIFFEGGVLSAAHLNYIMRSEADNAVDDVMRIAEKMKDEYFLLNLLELGNTEEIEVNGNKLITVYRGITHDKIDLTTGEIKPVNSPQIIIGVEMTPKGIRAVLHIK